MRVVTKNVYTFDELSDKAKERARDWWRIHWWRTHFEFDAEYVIEDACDVADLMGLDIRQTRKSRADGSAVWAPSVYYTGFCSQGDGASFSGKYSYRKDCVKLVKKYAPQDTALHRIAEALTRAQRSAFYKLTADIQQRGRYYHEMTMDINVHYRNDEYRTVPEECEGDIIEALRDFARWIYRQLEQAYEYQTSDECVDETLAANEYEFDEAGNPA